MLPTMERTFANVYVSSIQPTVAPIAASIVTNSNTRACIFAVILVFVCTQVAQELSSKFNKKQASVLDLCCGVGFSTRAMGEAFPDAEKVVGLDTSNEMIAMANFINTQIHVLKPWYDQVLNQGHKIQMGAQNICSAVFEKGNAEQTPFKDASFDLVTIMYVLLLLLLTIIVGILLLLH
jgi:SAM-dependent methyltransferase